MSSAPILWRTSVAIHNQVPTCFASSSQLDASPRIYDVWQPVASVKSLVVEALGGDMLANAIKAIDWTEEGAIA
jgi:hypothetical protein